MRFSLQSLLLAFVLVCSCMAAFGKTGILVGFYLAVIAVYVRSPDVRHGVAAMSAAARIILILLFLAPVLAVLPSYLSVPRWTDPQSACHYRLRTLAVALQAYHDDHGSFPLAYIADADGKPMHSWRVLLLPYLEYPFLYDAYDFGEPWDGPNNRKLATRIREYHCRSDHEASDYDTSYFAVVGPDAAWPGDTPRACDDFGKGRSGTIMLVEVHNSGIHWMEPRDITADELRRAVAAETGDRLLSRHRSADDYFHLGYPGANVAMADGSVWLLSEDTSPETLDALLRFDPSKSVDAGVLDATRLRWDRIVAIIAMVGSFLLLVFRPRRSGE